MTRKRTSVKKNKIIRIEIKKRLKIFLIKGQKEMIS